MSEAIEKIRFIDEETNEEIWFEVIDEVVIDQTKYILVVDEDDIPEPLEEMIDEREDKPFKLTYADNGVLYIAVGYGEQPTTGYSIQVKELYESENAIYIHTNLIGPAKDEKIIEKETDPYIVIKTEFIDKNVVFQ